VGEYALLEPRPGGEFTLDVKGAPVRGRYPGSPQSPTLPGGQAHPESWPHTSLRGYFAQRDHVQVMLPGAALLPVARKPKVVDAPAARVPL
jgi:hypothetical protein